MEDILLVILIVWVTFLAFLYRDHQKMLYKHTLLNLELQKQQTKVLNSMSQTVQKIYNKR